MKKKISRIASVILCIGMVMSGLSGCGSKNDEEILVQGIAAINEADSYEMSASYAGTIALQEGDAPATETKLETAISETVFKEPLRVKMTSKTVTELDEATETATYIQKEDDRYAMYTKVYSVWSKTYLEDAATAMNSAGTSACMVEQLSEDISRYEKKEDQKEGDTSYLVYEYTFSEEEVLNGIETMIRSWGSTGATGEVATAIQEVAKTIGELKATLVFDREEKCLVRVEYPVSELMTKTIGAMLEAMVAKSDSAKSEETEKDSEEGMNLAEALSQISIEAKNMTLVMTYENINNAKDFEIPQEALETESYAEMTENEVE